MDLRSLSGTNAFSLCVDLAIRARPLRASSPGSDDTGYINNIRRTKANGPIGSIGSLRSIR